MICDKVLREQMQNISSDLLESVGFRTETFGSAQTFWCILSPGY